MGVIETLLASVCTVQFCVLAVITLVLYYNVRNMKYKLPPRPRGWPVIGNMFALDPLNLHKWCLTQAKECGSDIIRIKVGVMQEAIVIHNVKHATEALVDRGKDFLGRPDGVVFEERTEGYMDVGFADADHPNWGLRRKLFATSVRNFTNGRAFEERTKLTFGRMIPILDAKAESGEPFDPKSICKLYITNHMAGLVFSKTFQLDDEEFINIIQDAENFADQFNKFNISDALPFLNLLPFPMPDRLRVRSASTFFSGFLRKEIKKHKETFTGQEQSDLTYYILKVMSEDKTAYSALSEVEQRQLILDVFSAGIDTSQTQLRWMVGFLAAHPHVQDRLYQEIVDVVGPIDKKDPDFGVSSIDYRTAIPYIDAFILESSRMGTVAPLGLPRKAMCDSRVGEYDVPKGTHVIINQYAINFNAKELDKPEEFRPERFLTQEGRLGPRPGSFMPFGAGRRSCPGETASRNTLWMSLVMLLRRYQILPPEGGKLTIRYGLKSPLLGEPADYEIRLKYRN